MQGNKPPAYGVKESSWTDSAVRKVAMKKLQIPISRTESLRLMQQWKLNTPNDAHDDTESKIPGPGPVKEDQPENDEDDFYVPDLATMQQLNAETTAAIKKHTQQARPGKHSKGKSRNRKRKRKKKR